MNKIPRKYIGLYKKAQEGRSRKAAIRSFCLLCCCFQEKEVVNCSDFTCPLYKYRKYG